MSDGDIFKYQNGFFLQLGELEGSPKAPLASVCKNTSDQIRNCDPEFPKFYIPKWVFEGLLLDHCYISLAKKSVALIPLAKIQQMSLVTNLSYLYMNAITRCAFTHGAVWDDIRPYLRANRR